MGNRKIVDQLIKEGALRFREHPRPQPPPDATAAADAASLFATAAALSDESTAREEDEDLLHHASATKKLRPSRPAADSDSASPSAGALSSTVGEH